MRARLERSGARRRSARRRPSRRGRSRSGRRPGTAARQDVRADAATARIRAARCLMCCGTFLRKSSRNSSWRSADTGMRLTIEAAPLARTAAGRLPSTLPSRTIARKNAGSSFGRQTDAEQDGRPGEAARGDHLERDGRTHAESDHDVRADLRRQLGREPRVVLDAVVVRRRRAGVAGQRRGDQPHPCEGGFCHHLGIGTRAAHAAGKQQHGVLGVARARLAKLPVNSPSRTDSPDCSRTTPALRILSIDGRPVTRPSPPPRPQARVLRRTTACGRGR